jgi:hypothetical protein
MVKDLLTVEESAAYERRSAAAIITAYVLLGISVSLLFSAGGFTEGLAIPHSGHIAKAGPGSAFVSKA